MLFLFTKLHLYFCRLMVLQIIFFTRSHYFSENWGENKTHGKCKRRYLTTISSSVYEEHEFSKDVYSFCQISPVRKFQIKIIKFSQDCTQHYYLLYCWHECSHSYQRLGYPDSWTWDSQVPCCELDWDPIDILSRRVQVGGTGGVHCFFQEHPYYLFWLHFPRKQLLYLFSLQPWRWNTTFHCTGTISVLQWRPVESGKNASNPFLRDASV